MLPQLLLLQLLLLLSLSLHLLLSLSLHLLLLLLHHRLLHHGEPHCPPHSDDQNLLLQQALLLLLLLLQMLPWRGVTGGVHLSDREAEARRRRGHSSSPLPGWLPARAGHLFQLHHHGALRRPLHCDHQNCLLHSAPHCSHQQC